MIIFKIIPIFLKIVGPGSVDSPVHPLGHQDDLVERGYWSKGVLHGAYIELRIIFATILIF